MSYRCELGAGVNIFGAHLALKRPDVVVEPGKERKIVGVAAQQRHRGVRVRIEKTRHDRQTGSVVRFVGNGVGRGMEVMKTVAVDQNVRDVTVELNIANKKGGHDGFKRSKDG